MSCRWEIDMAVLRTCSLFSPERKTAECPFCRNTFHPRFFRPTPDQTFGHWQRFCSGTCKRLFNQEEAALRAVRAGEIGVYL